MYQTREHSGSNWNLEMLVFRRWENRRTNNKLEAVWKEVRVTQSCERLSNLVTLIPQELVRIDHVHQRWPICNSIVSVLTRPTGLTLV